MKLIGSEVMAIQGTVSALLGGSGGGIDIIYYLTVASQNRMNSCMLTVVSF